MRYLKIEYFSPRSRCLCHCFWKEPKVQMICVRQDVTRPGVDRSEKASTKKHFFTSIYVIWRHSEGTICD